MARRKNIERDDDRAGEKILRRTQRQVVAGQTALADRDTTLARLYERGYTQGDLVKILNDENRAAGAPELSEDAVQKAIRKIRNEPGDLAPAL